MSDVQPTEQTDQGPSQSLATDRDSLAEAQRNRPAEQVGPPLGHAAVRRVTADEADPQRSWTVQSGVMMPNPHDERNVVTRFNRAELPDPQKAVDAGLLPLLYPAHLLSDDHVTQPPSANPALDDPVRARPENAVDPGYEWSSRTNVDATLEAAKAQREGAAVGS